MTEPPKNLKSKAPDDILCMAYQGILGQRQRLQKKLSPTYNEKDEKIVINLDKEKSAKKNRKRVTKWKPEQNLALASTLLPSAMTTTIRTCAATLRVANNAPTTKDKVLEIVNQGKLSVSQVTKRA